MRHKTTKQQMQGLALTLSGMLFSLLGFAQVTVSGKVTEANAATAPAAISVIIRGTNYGTSADAGGNYSISAPLKVEATRLYLVVWATSARSKILWWQAVPPIPWMFS